MTLGKILKTANELKSKVVNASCGCADLSEYRFVVSMEVYEEMAKEAAEIMPKISASKKTGSIQTLLGIPIQVMNMPNGMEIALVKKHDLEWLI